MNQVEVRGRYLGCSDVTDVGTNGTTIRRFWVDVSDNPQYPNIPEFQLVNDKCKLVEHLTTGCEVEVKARLRGRKVTDKEGNERIFVSIDAWKIDVLQRTSAAFVTSAPVPPDTTPVGTFANPTPEPMKRDMLPF